MKYFVLLVLAAVAVWFFFVRVDPSTSGAGVRLTALSPEQQFKNLLAEGTVDAARLSVLCSAYPALAANILRGKQIQIKGTVAAVSNSGMEGRRANVMLSGGGDRKVVLVCDLDQYTGSGVNFRYLGKFQAVGTELLYLLERHGTLTKKVVTTQGSDVTQFCALKTMGASMAEFQMVNGPVWAKAETNH